MTAPSSPSSVAARAPRKPSGAASCGRFDGFDGNRRRRNDSGQAAVEAAIVMPSMVFLVLGIMQLTMVQQARVMTEYAAFCAARAGIVYGADRTAMIRAAELALLPTMGRADTLGAFNSSVATVIPRELGEHQIFTLPLVAITIKNPTAAQVGGTLSQHLLGHEIDFDDVRAAGIQANVLTIQLMYYYHMKIPFANQMLEMLFFAQVGGASQFFSQPESGLETSNAILTNKVDVATAEGAFASGGRTVTPLAGALVNAARRNYFYFPVSATYSMQMQSNISTSSL